MSIVIPLSSKPAERLKEQADLGLFPWSDLDAARPMVEAACEESGDNAEREAELILLALQENVAGAIRRALDRNPDVRMERCLGQVADYYGSLKTIASQVTLTEARWSVDTLAAIANLIPTSAVGATASSASSSSPSKNSPRPPSAPKGASASPPPAANLSQQPSWAASQATSSAPPWAQAPMGAAAIPQVPAAMNPTTSLPPPQGIGIAAGAGVAYDRPGGAPGQSWPPTPGGYGGAPNDAAAVPDEVANNKWSWAGFLGGVLWMCSHRLLYPALTWLALLIVSFVAKPIGSAIGSIGNLCLAIYLGINGNRLAWSHRRFQSVEQFRTVQRIWVRVSLALIVLWVILLGLSLLPVFLHAYNAARQTQALPGSH